MRRKMPVPKFKSHPVEFDQHLLFPSNVYDLLAEDHDCFVYADIFQHLDTAELEATYHHRGQNAYHPRHIVSILIYAYSHGVFSSREIERRCRQDLAFMYIAQQHCPNFRVLSDFRKDHNEFFHGCFKQSVQLALELKMASLGHISLDGSKFKADSSKHKAMSYGRLKELEEALTTEIEELIERASRCDAEEDASYQNQSGYSVPDDLAFKQQRLEKIKAAKAALEAREEIQNPDQEIDDKKQISFADHDARIMGKKGDFDYSYNAQISVDEDHQIIVGQHVSQNANDLQEVEPALKALNEATDGQSVAKMSMDNGYCSGPNLKVLDEAKVDSYIATDRQEKAGKDDLASSDRKFVKADFSYLPEEDCFVCPAGERMISRGGNAAQKKNYRAASAVCSECAFQSRCSSSKKKAGREIRADEYESYRQAMNRKMEAAEAKAIYDRRKVIVEPAFGHIKNGGFRGFSLRGLKKVEGEFSLVCAAYNFKKMVKAALTGAVCLNDVKKAEYGV